MLPTSRTVRDDPVLDRILRDSGSHFLALRIHRAAIDGPVAVRAIEVERARDARRRDLVRQAVELRNRRRIDAVVRNWRQIDDDLEDQVALAGRKNFAGWTT